jgi:hypothetical protein
MATKDRRKRKPKRKPDPDNRDSNGRYKAGHCIPGPGRPAISQEQKERAVRALEFMLDVASGEVEIDEDDELRYRAARDVALMVFTRKPRFAGDLPTTPEERIKALEEVMLSAALSTDDPEAAAKMLAVLDPVRWGKAVKDPSDEKNDTVGWEEMEPTT